MRAAAALAVVMLLAACGGDGEGLTELEGVLLEHVRAEAPDLESPRVVLTEELADGLAVGTVAGQGRAFAAILRDEGGEWRVETRAGPDVEPLAPGAGEQVEGAVSVTVRAPPGAQVGLWIGEGALRVEATEQRVFLGSVEEPLEPGPHVVTAVAVRGGTASAAAWTFEVG